MIALQSNGVYWRHSDPVTKGQRMTNSAGQVVSTVELDPFGGETARSSNTAFEKHRFTTYERDTNGGDDAQARRYEGKHQRFAQPDPYDGSYDLSDPQSLNRYSYVENDPVNFIDPSGLDDTADFWAWFLGANVGATVNVTTDFSPDLSGLLSLWLGGMSRDIVLPMIPIIGDPTGGDPGTGGDPPIIEQNHQELRHDFYNFLKNMSDDCKNALKDFMGTLTKLAYGASLYDVNKLGNVLASKYVGARGGTMTLGQWFDSGGSDARTVVGETRSGIYFRSISTFIGDNIYLLLHEMMHLAYPVVEKGDLDKPLADLLKVSRRGNESWSGAVSRYFNSKCNPKERGP
jgi:RHS repeat-associated protein